MKRSTIQVTVLIVCTIFLSSSKFLPSVHIAEPVIWSEWAAIERSTDSEETLVFHSYFLAGTITKSLNPLKISPRTGKDIPLKLHAELFKGSKSLGVICEGLKTKEAREIYMPNGTWGTFGSNFKYQGMDGNRKAWLRVSTKDLTNGSYEIKVMMIDPSGKRETRNFKFQVSDKRLVGDESITETAFKKKHDIKRLERQFVFITANK